MVLHNRKACALVKRFYRLLVLCKFSVNFESDKSAGKLKVGL
jgi:ribosomal protein L36